MRTTRAGALQQQLGFVCLVHNFTSCLILKSLGTAVSESVTWGQITVYISILLGILSHIKLLDTTNKKH